MNSSSYSSQSTRPSGRVLWEELLVLFQILLVITSGLAEFSSPDDHSMQREPSKCTSSYMHTLRYLSDVNIIII